SAALRRRSPGAGGGEADLSGGGGARCDLSRRPDASGSSGPRLPAEELATGRGRRRLNADQRGHVVGSCATRGPRVSDPSGAPVPPRAGVPEARLVGGSLGGQSPP